MNVEPAGLRRVVVTLDLADGPHIDVLAVPALRLSEWMHHEGIAPARTALEITGPALPTTT